MDKKKADVIDIRRSVGLKSHKPVIDTNLVAPQPIDARLQQRRLKAKIPVNPVDEWWCYTYYSIRCDHYGQPRQRSKGI